jgi:prepilin peptidase CpaA
MLEASILIVFPFCMAFAAVSDLLSMTIANRVSIILVLAFAVIAPMTGMGWPDYGWHLAAGALVLSITFGLFAIGGMGGGDAKLMSATAVWFGMSFPLLSYLVVSAFLGGLLTLLILSYRKSPLAVYTGHNAFLKHLADSDTGIPYGLALGVGGLMAFPESALMAWVLERLTAL